MCKEMFFQKDVDLEQKIRTKIAHLSHEEKIKFLQESLTDKILLFAFEAMPKEELVDMMIRMLVKEIKRKDN